MRFIINLFPIARWVLPLVVIFVNLFPRPVMAGTVTTDYVSWESNIPNAPPVVTASLAGTGGAVIPDPFGITGFASVDMSLGAGMVYSSDGTMLCIEPDGTNLPTAYFYMDALTDNVGIQVSGNGIVAFYDASRSSVTEGFGITSGFNGVNGLADTDLFFIQGATATDTLCVGPFYYLEDVDGDGFAGDIDCDEVDNDLDGSSACDDCDDTNVTVYPGAVELEDGLDNNCSGLVDEGTNAYDDDADGYTENAGDCDDGNIVVFPGAVELCNSTDDDCDGIIDEGTTCYDDDGDGLTENDGDCDDTNATVYLGATELCDGIDQDCDGLEADGETDLDGDGYATCDDCDDTNAAVNKGQSETPYNGVDDDCNELTLDDDLDSDGYGYVSDCDDSNSGVNPGVSETAYNGIDDDCDPATADDDLDSDGYLLADDCDDTNSGINPGASEVAYDGIDQDCSGADLDDVDGDGASYPADCNDANSAIYPGAVELCNSLDDNCDGDVDEGLDSSCYETDSDGDGYTPESGDCNDTDAAINPGASDIPDNGIDEDCDGADLSDLDGDGYGRSEGDCDDTNAAINPGAIEVCDGIDQDCDGVIDDHPIDGSLWYADADEDGWGDDSSTVVECDRPEGYVAVGNDCDDHNITVYPGASEVPDNGIDEDCDGEDTTTPGDTGDTGVVTDTAEPIFDTGGVKIYGSGCGCSSSAYTGLGWLWLLPLLLMRRRV